MERQKLRNQEQEAQAGQLTPAFEQQQTEAAAKIVTNPTAQLRRVGHQSLPATTFHVVGSLTCALASAPLLVSSACHAGMVGEQPLGIAIQPLARSVDLGLALSMAPSCHGSDASKGGGTVAITAGEQLRTIAGLLGHAEVTTTMGYVRLAQGPIKAAAGRVSNHLATAIAPAEPLRLIKSAMRTRPTRRRKLQRAAKTEGPPRSMLV